MISLNTAIRIMESLMAAKDSMGSLNAARRAWDFQTQRDHGIMKHSKEDHEIIKHSSGDRSPLNRVAGSQQARGTQHR
jgi:hypothetical protein